MGLILLSTLVLSFSLAHAQENLDEVLNEDSQEFELDFSNDDVAEEDFQESPQEEFQTESIVEESASTEEQQVSEESSTSESLDSNYDPMIELYGNADAYSYKSTRGGWGAIVGFGLSSYNPEDYQPDFAPSESYSSYYGTPDTPMMELNISLKKNIAFFSASADVSAGYLTNTNTDGGSLLLVPITFGGSLALDAVFNEPYVVPYVRGGGYLVYYRESQDNISVNGNTSVSPFYAFGLRFQLDWLDSDGDNASYEDYGLHNTYLYVEARQFFALNEDEPDLSSPTEMPLHVNAGLSFEF